MDPIDFAHLILASIGLYIFLKVASPLWAALTGNDAGKRRHCMTCGSEAEPKSHTSGSMGIEILLWLCFIIPGLLYSLWRLTTRKQVCSVCGATNLVPVSTPAAMAHRANLQGQSKT